MIPSDFQFRIYGWMVSKYRLRGNDLIVFAYLHYHTVCMVEHGCVQSRKEIAAHLGISVNTVHKVMESLYLNGLAEKCRMFVRGNMVTVYRTTVEEKGYEKA